MLERSRRRFELMPNPHHLKYESYSKPKATHFQLRIIWLLSIVTQPLQSKLAAFELTQLVCFNHDSCQ
ncbi:hypothetical protein DVH03_05410 [Lactiplantibacillus plantarum]|nr:hypothetical protein DVH03_05410 [Lactiplantibacillus plantarum]